MNIPIRIAALLLPVVMLWSISCVRHAKEEVPDNISKRRPDVYMAQGRYEEALDIYGELLSGHDKDRELLQDYRAALLILKERAEEQYTAANYGASERIYRLLLAEVEKHGPFSAPFPLQEESLKARIRESRIGLAMKLSRQHMNSENYLMALNSLRAVHMQYPDDSDLLKHYIASVKQVNQRAEQAFNVQDYWRAGQVYHVLNMHVAYIKKVAPASLFDGQSIDRVMAFCSSALMKEALVHYRAGDLPAAITLWKNILDFSPSDKEAQKAIEVATRQLRNVEQPGKNSHSSITKRD